MVSGIIKLISYSSTVLFVGKICDHVLLFYNERTDSPGLQAFLLDIHHSHWLLWPINWPILTGLLGLVSVLLFLIAKVKDQVLTVQTYHVVLPLFYLLMWVIILMIASMIEM